MSPRVSVITTVYNGAGYIDRAIPSILAQEYTDFEYIVVDDGSTDATPALLANIANLNSRVRILTLPRSGRVAALNFGIKHSLGQYVANIDIDDLAFPERLACQVSYLDEHPETGVVGGAFNVKDDIRRLSFTRMPPTDSCALSTQMSYMIPFCHSVATFRKEAWEQVDGYKNVCNEDLFLWYEMALCGWKLGAVKACVGEHWKHQDSFWSANFSNFKRHQELAHLQTSIAKGLKLPWYYRLFAQARRLYPLLPTPLQRATRSLLTKDA